MGALNTARTLANALDRGDYDTAAAVIAADCVYELAGRIIRGRDAILKSYRAADTWGQTALDNVVFESSVHELDDGRIAIEYQDHLQCGGHQHTHHCRQVTTVQGGLIV